MKKGVLLLMLLSLTACCGKYRSGADTLASWNDSPNRESIINFVNSVTDPDSADYVAPEKRIAVFDNDGTLWSEKPIYVQLQFTLERIKQLAINHPEWHNKQPYKAVLENNLGILKKLHKKQLMQLLMATHAEMSNEEFTEQVHHWLANAEHPRFKRPYTSLVYQPMLELLDYLQQHQFKTYIVSGGGVEFMRPWTEAVYGIPPEQVIGSSIKTQFQYNQGKPTLQRRPAINFINDKAGKPVAIDRVIGRRPILAAGNSDGDLQMLQWTDASPDKTLKLLVHHTDADREYAYDKKTRIGRLYKALQQAKQKNWTIIDMQKDWNRIFKERD